MNDVNFWKLITDYGIAIVGLVFLTRFLMWLIRYILERNKQREDCFTEMMKGDLKHLADSMSNLTTNMSNFTNSVNEAHRFQRDEHKQMVETLVALNTKINGFRLEKKD